MEYQVDQAIEVLQNTPVVLRSMLAGLSEPWIHNNYGPDTFCPFDVVGHLILGEQTDWIPRARIILEHGESRTFVPFDRYAMYEESKGKTIGELLDTFQALRAETIQALQSFNLGPEQLKLRGSHPELGVVQLRNHLSLWVVHDLNHIHQIAKCMAYQYRGELGPWLPYCGVLQ